MQVDSTGTRLAPRQFSSAAEVMENTRRVMAFRRKSRVRAVIQKLPEIRDHQLDLTPRPIILDISDPIFRGGITGQVQAHLQGQDAEMVRYFMEDIKREACGYFKISRVDIMSDRRTQNLVFARQIAMSLCKHLTTNSLPKVGKAFGGRDHTTVLHATRKMSPALDYAAAHLKLGDPISAWLAVAAKHACELGLDHIRKRIA